MDAIIEFLFANLAFIIFVVVGLYNFFKRTGNGEDVKKAKKPKQQKRSQGLEEAWKQAKETFEKQMSSKEREQPTTSTIQNEQSDAQKKQREQSTIETSNYYEKKKQSVQKTMHTENGGIGKELVPKPLPRKKQNRQRGAAVKIAGFSKSNVVEGVVYSEILQPPRAYNPHPVTKKYRPIHKR